MTKNTKKYMSKWRSNNREKVRKYSREYHSQNKDRYKEQRANYYQENKEKHALDSRRNHLLKNHSITPEAFDKLLQKQNSLCKICDKELIGKERPCIDHCHKTGKIRGLLCRRCNLSLSVIEDKEFVKKAHQYLQRSEAEDKEPLR